MRGTLKKLDEDDKQFELEFTEINKLADQGQLKESLELCESLFELYPEHPRVLHAVGMLRYRTGMGRDEVEPLLRKSIQLKPDFADAYYNLGNVLYNVLLEDEAEEHLRFALKYNPLHFRAMSTLATVLISKGEMQEAQELCEKALVICPEYSMVYQVYGNVLQAFGRVDEAIIFYRKGLEINKFDSASCLLFAMNLTPQFSQKEIFMESARWGQRLSQNYNNKIYGHLNSLLPDRRIRIGYVSGDFKWHPVSFHLKPVLASHNKQRVEIFLYNTFPLTDSETEALADFADIYRDISSLANEAAEILIRKDGIDILVDLAGHTSFHRLELFVRKPAPVQVSWLGYFNTTGLSAIDYLLSDPITNPPEYDAYFSEKVFRLLGCRFCYQPVTYDLTVAVTPALHNGYLTFGSFNSIQKISSNMIELWSRLLLEIPNARIILKSLSFENDSVVADFFRKFAAHGVTAERIELRPYSKHMNMMAEYGDIDIALDTFPYNGGATTCEALWMGVPVVTLEGETPISRQSKAFLHTIGYPEWVATTADEYIEVVRGLTSNLGSLQKIRAGLRQKMLGSPLCDGKAFTEQLEAAYRQMWQSWCDTAIPVESFNEFSTDELCATGYNYLNDGETKQALEILNRVLRRDPTHVQALNGLGKVFEKMGDYPSAVKAFRKAIRRDSSYFQPYFNLGFLLLNCEQFKGARKAFQLALELDPENIETLFNLSVTNRLLGNLLESQLNCEKVLEISPYHTSTLGQLAYVVAEQGDIRRAIELFEKALKLDPENPKLLAGFMPLMFYRIDSKQSEIFELSKRIARNFRVGSLAVMPLEKRDVLRIGFVSADFRYHPVGLLLTALFMEYNSEKLSLYCYGNLSKPDSWTELFQNHATAWRDISRISDEEAAKLIRDDKIDILVDLSGHTSGNRLQMFTLRPAAVTATWMGFSHTTGLDSIDYIIADDDFIRPDDEQWFSEKVIRLPYNRFCFTPPAPSPEVVDPPCCDNNYITFGSFNNPIKISDQVVAVWAKILLCVPRSRLILKYYSFSDSSVRQRYLNLFAKYGVARNRIKFRKHIIPFLMMSEYGDIDIALDPFPFTGGMTSLYSLWMGVPIVTLAGELPISRQTKSFLDLVGLGDLVAYTFDEYFKKTIALANDSERLMDIRESLRHTMLESPLCDAKRYSKDVCDLFFRMWDEKRSM
jgi:predicted O-linked N-acetylglucosamine transferase (SPINDLY family)